MRDEDKSIAIEVTDVSKRYGHIDALSGLSMRVQQGEIFGLLGANGAGKTTLIKVLIAMTRPDSGTLSVLGLNPKQQMHTLRQQIGYMPQAPALYDDLSARDNLRFFGQAHEMSDLEQRINDVLDFTNLRNRERDVVSGFSGGMKQRLSLACALIHRPRLLLLDEPSTGVDPKLREAFWGHFRDLTAQGVTILVSTHQMDEALHCDRVAVMRDGRVLAVDSPSGLLARGRAAITIWHDSTSETHTVDQYSEQLPRLLGISPAVDRIEVRQDTLEDIVLRLINTTEATHA